MRKKVLMIDNYDSFTFNLVQYLEEIGSKVTVARNDKITLAEIKRLKPECIVISPGPGTPKQGGISNATIKTFYKDLPILGVCLGHQCIGYVFGGIVTYAPRLMHGKTSLIYHNKKDIFKKIPNPFTATRYHSLIVSKKNFPDCLEIVATCDKDVIMGIRHREYPCFGVQFHPESILTEHGKLLLKNFLQI
ncbi:MAG: aminodeoxychorismate/anthranilate synthase component II [Candidatus Hydrogenedentota bacterium]